MVVDSPKVKLSIFLYIGSCHDLQYFVAVEPILNIRVFAIEDYVNNWFKMRPKRKADLGDEKEMFDLFRGKC